MTATPIAELPGLSIEADIAWVRGNIVWESDWCPGTEEVEAHQTLELSDPTGSILVLIWAQPDLQPYVGQLLNLRARSGQLWRDQCDAQPIVVAGPKAVLTIVER